MLTHNSRATDRLARLLAILSISLGAASKQIGMSMAGKNFIDGSVGPIDGANRCKILPPHRLLLPLVRR